MSDATFNKICRGEADCMLNVVCFPFVLLWNGLYIYVFSCFAVLYTRAYHLLCKPFCFCCWQFTDKSFEGASAIGSNSSVDWVRAEEVVGMQPKLYEGGIEPADLAQGAVGDCWLVAAIACAAEHPGAIRKVFLTPEYNPRGKYRVRLFDPERKRWEIVTVDDRLPCKAGTKTPLYMKCHNNELWAVLLEKAFAKFCGSYKHLDGGWAMWGWRVLTGDHVFRLSLSDANGRWTRKDFKAKRGKRVEDGVVGEMYTTTESYNSHQVWNLILNYMEADCLVAASGGKDMGTDSGNANSGGLNGEQLNEAAGLVGTHAYSILDARELGLIPGLSLGNGILGQTKLIKLRNPWGSYEWKGAWSDGSKEWRENPLIKMRLRPKDEDDGCFWMPWDQFYTAGFKNIDICDRTTKDDLRLSVEEDMGSCGVVAGCLLGLTQFFCLCKGVTHIYFGHTSSAATKSSARGCAACCASDPVAPATANV